MFWKIFAIVTVLATLGSVAAARLEPQGILHDLDVVMGIISSSIVAAYAFKSPMKARNVAKGFAWVFSAYSIWTVASSLVSLQASYMEGRTSPSTYILVMVVVCLQTFLEWLAVWRYGQDSAFDRQKAAAPREVDATAKLR